MPIITAADLKTNTYQEIIDEITREDSTIVDKAIATAIAEAKMYLSRYDLLKLFGDSETEPETTDEALQMIIKDQTMWHLIRLANVNLQYDHIRTCYLDAMEKLKAIQKGTMNPDWPYQDRSEATAAPGLSVTSFSNRKRSNRY